MFTHRPCPCPARESICPLTNWLPASGAACGAHKLREHVPPDQPTASAACRTDRFHRPIIRACPPQEVLRTAYEDASCGKQRLCEHALAGKLTLSAVCRNDKLHIPRNRVCPPQESGTKKREVQLLLSRGQESGIFCRNLLYTA